MSYLCQKCKKKIGGHRLRFRDKACGKLYCFEKLSHIVEHGLQRFKVKNSEGELTEENDLSHIL